jgi:hypothetical protein
MTFSASERGSAGQAKPQPSPDGEHQQHAHYRRDGNGATTGSESGHIGRQVSEIVVAGNADNVPHQKTGPLLSRVECLYGDRGPGAASRRIRLHGAIAGAVDPYLVVTRLNDDRFSQRPEPVRCGCCLQGDRRAIPENLLEYKGFLAQHGPAFPSGPLEPGGSRGSR